MTESEKVKWIKNIFEKYSAKKLQGIADMAQKFADFIKLMAFEKEGMEDLQ